MRSYLSALALLVTGVFANHAHTPMATNDSALLADLFDAGANLHGDVLPVLLVAICDTTASEVVGSEFHLHLVARKNSDVMHPHFSGDVSQDLVAIFEFHSEHCIWE